MGESPLMIRGPVKQPAFPSTVRAKRGERRLALVVVILSLLLFLLCVPFARLQLPAVWAFIPIYETALAITDLITAGLIFSQFNILRSRSLLVLACGYLFSTIMVVVHGLTFPGLFAPGGLLGAGPQTTAWLYMFWHGGFPLFVAAYALLKDKDNPALPSSGVHGSAVFAALIGVFAAAAAFTWLATVGQQSMPAIMQGNGYTPTMIFVVSAVWTLGFIALLTLWICKPHSALDLWLMVVMCAWMCDVALSAVFNAGRFDLGFYTGRIYGLIAASFVLLMLLFETGTLYAGVVGLLETEQEERQREAQEHRLIFNTSLDLILVTDRKGRFVRVSPSVLTLLGYHPAEMIGRNGAEFIHPNDLDRTRDEMRHARRGRETRNFECRYIGKDGRIVMLSWTGVWSEAVQQHFFIGRDVTESRTAQEALKLEVEGRKRVAEVLRNTIASIVDPLLVVDAEGKVLITNPPARSIFGKISNANSDFGDRPCERFYPDGVTPFPFESTPLRRALKGEPIDDLEFIVKPKDGTQAFHLLASGRPIRSETGELQGAVTIFRDVTASRQAEQKLRDSEQMARAIIDTALDAFVQIDETGTVLDWSPKAQDLFGWTREEAIGRRIGDLVVSPADRETHVKQIEQFVRDSVSGGPGKRYEATSVKRDGTEISTEISLSALRRGDGTIVNGFIRDITDRKAAEEQLLQAQKMESVGQLTGGIAHDFNNVLTVITGTIDLLAEAVADKPELSAIAKLIGEAAERGAELTGHLLAFARKQPLRPRMTDVYELIAETTSLIRSTLGEHIEIETRLQPDVWPALVDPSQLTTALLNLALNARDAMPDGGKLTVEVDNIVVDETYAHNNGDIKPGRYVLIAVSDTGSGIPESIRSKVFEPFFTTKEVGKGTGLGLSMVYGFVKQSGGHIKLYSEMGHGTTFRIYLPQAGDKPLTAEDEAAEPSFAGNSETILVVEDDALVRHSVIAQLQGFGYRTIAATNAAEALTVADRGTPFDLLFTDIIMPGPMNGRQLAEAIAARRSPLKVLFTSGYTEDAVIHHGRLDPGVLLLAKPYRRSDLAHMVRQALDSPATFESGGVAPRQPRAIG